MTASVGKLAEARRARRGQQPGDYAPCGSHEAQSSLALATTRVPDYTPGAGDTGTKADLDRLLALSKKVLPQLVLRKIGGLEEEDFAFDYGYVYHAEGGT